MESVKSTESVKNESANQIGRELSIASSFVRQYYTLLNSAPHYVPNFYSHDSTFIHGTIDLANEQYTEPVVGREMISKKINDLNVTNCRAKIKQIDCLETLAGGLVIQVIGELSINSKPMRRFLQTFVLAPSPKEAEQAKPIPNNAGGPDKRVGQGDTANDLSSNQNQKFFVLNDIFRYQDDGPESEYEGDSSLSTCNSSEGQNIGGVVSGSGVEPASSIKLEPPLAPPQPQVTRQAQATSANGSTSDNFHQTRRRVAETPASRDHENVDRIAGELDENLKLNKAVFEQGGPRARGELAGPKSVASTNGTGNLDKRSETFEKASENERVAPVEESEKTIGASDVGTSNQQATAAPVGQLATPTATNAAGPAAAAATPQTSASRPQPSNEPKTWANMVRNANPPSATVSSGTKTPSLVDQQPKQPRRKSHRHVHRASNKPK